MPASSTDYVHFGQAVSKDSAKPGDIIVFKGYNAGGTGPGHVGMITEITANEIYFIHSANRGGIRYDKLSQKYYKDRFLFIRRVLR
jgi:cell wall-associated NlpC family hydrolase